MGKGARLMKNSSILFWESAIRDKAVKTWMAEKCTPEHLTKSHRYRAVCRNLTEAENRFKALGDANQCTVILMGW